MNAPILPWYIAGPLIGLMVPLLLILREKQLGLSSSMRYLGSVFFSKNDYFMSHRLADGWQVQFGLGIVLSAVVLFSFNLVEQPELRLDDSTTYLHAFSDIYSISNWWIFLLGGTLIGFGARYADGCTAGHCIMGISLLSPASLLTTVFFFVGGLLVSHLVIPYLF
jgi:uncharacterized protein